MVIVATLLIVADLAFGVLAAMKRKEKITSAGLRRTITKLLAYNVCITIGFLVETYLIGGTIPISNLIAGIVGLTEGKSLLENAEELLGQPVFKSVLDKLKSQNDEH
jgi:phage-related holin